MSGEERPETPPQRVERTGIALVHEGEWIFPQEDSTARLAPASQRVVNYYFPVEIEVIGGGAAAIAEQIYRELREKFEDLG